MKRQQRTWAWADNLRLHVITPGWASISTAVDECHALEATGQARGVEPVTLPDGTYTVGARQVCVMGFWMGDRMGDREKPREPQEPQVKVSQP